MTRSAWGSGSPPWRSNTLARQRASGSQSSGRIGRCRLDGRRRHLAERCGLFIIIALGESLLVTGATFSGLPWTTPVIAAMVAAFGAAVAMWWVYFDVTAEAATERIAHSDEPGGLARLAYTFSICPWSPASSSPPWATSSSSRIPAAPRS